jgi:hypothetical protein
MPAGVTIGSTTSKVWAGRLGELIESGDDGLDRQARALPPVHLDRRSDCATLVRLAPFGVPRVDRQPPGKPWEKLGRARCGIVDRFGRGDDRRQATGARFERAFESRGVRG